MNQTESSDVPLATQLAPDFPGASQRNKGAAFSQINKYVHFKVQQTDQIKCLDAQIFAMRDQIWQQP